MRITGLLLIFLLGLISVCAGPASGQSQAATDSATPATPAPRIDFLEGASDTAMKSPSLRRRLPRFGPQWLIPVDEELTYCLKMRSYLVARESKDSDATEFVGYTTCQPASKYELKTTIDNRESGVPRVDPQQK